MDSYTQAYNQLLAVNPVFLCKSQFCIGYYFLFPAAQTEFAPLATLSEIDEKILVFYGRLKSSPRSDPERPFYLHQLVALRTQRREFSHQESDINKAITHSAEAVLLPPAHHTVVAFYHLALLLLSRYSDYNQPDDIKYSVKYFRFLRNNFHSLEAFDVPHTSGDLPSMLLRALSLKLLLTPGDMELDFEEMVALIPECISADALTTSQEQALYSFCRVLSRFMGTMFRQENTQKVANRATQVLREATVLNPDVVISYALAVCLLARFETTQVMNDYEEAIGTADRIIATYSPGNIPTAMERNAMLLISTLLMSRLQLSSRPDYLEDAIHRIRTFVPCLPDEDRELADVLDSLMRQRFDYFGIAGSSDGNPPPQTNPHFNVRIILGGEAMSQMNEIIHHLTEVTTAIRNGEITDVDATVERSRKSLPLQQPSDQWSPSYRVTNMFATVLFEAYKCTRRLNYLDEAITMFRYLHNTSAKGTRDHFKSGSMLSHSLMAHLELFPSREDHEELMRVFPELANNNSCEVFERVQISFLWAGLARVNMHPSVSIAYETAMSLLQEALVFCPTLQTKHLRLAQASKQGERLPSSSDYASYLIENGRVKQAVETLEQGRTLIWSEMRGLRTSTDQLCAADPALADKLADINQRLESVAMSVVQSDDEEIGRGEAGTESRGNSIGHLVLTQRRLLEERKCLISHIQSLPGFEHFLKPPSFDFLECVTSHGPVIIVNQTQANIPKDFPVQVPSHIILLLKDSLPFIISTPSNFTHRANELENDLLRVRKEKGLDSEDYGRTLASVLADLYELVGKPVIEGLRKFKVPEKSRVWWCPTCAFCSLPLHAMGPIPSDDGKQLYFSDLYIPSYTPSLSALIESRKRGSLSDASDNLKPSILLVAQPETLPGAVGEVITIVLNTKTPVTTLISAVATPDTVIEGLRGHRFAHFVCHGLLEAGKPFDASLELHGDNLTLLNIVGSRLPAAEFVFLSACHTAELTEGSAIDEGLHLAAAMQYCGFRSVVGTMWAMADTDGEDLSKHFYKAIFVDNADQNGVPYHERSAWALQHTVKKLRKKRGMTLERWVNFVHYGA